MKIECKSCKQGYLKSTGMALLSDPPQYPHQCTHCGITVSFDHCYEDFKPSIDYRLKDYLEDKSDENR